MDFQQIMKDICERPTVPLWPHVAAALNVSKSQVYASAARGDLGVDIVSIGRCRRAVTASLRKRLGIEATA